MPSWTKEQELAITKSGMNIIVSAGAGSGKTAVLTERVIRKLKQGIDVDRLLILTFTNAAAKEMKERIRSAIKKENLVDQLIKIDSSYITTFDSFALSLVKKYHYLLNIDNDIEIANELVLKWKKEEILDNIFTNFYQENNPLFQKLIKDFTVRDDDKLKKSILDIYNKIDLKYDKDEYLDCYLENYFNEKYLNEKIFEFEEILKDKIKKIDLNLAAIELIVDGDFYEKLLEPLRNLLNSNCYDMIKNNLDIKLPRLSKEYSDAKPYKDKISSLIKSLQKLTIYESQSEIYNSLLRMQDYIQIIIEILKELDKKFTIYKKENKLYDFLDISKLAIKIVSDYENVRLELKDYFQEILIDEYQDTSDLQELFILKIANNNLYMVGDIKQSIYRFRNANPNLFKDKYNLYQEGKGGVKIDLVKNFRSREETLANINYIFNNIMDLEIGGADYRNSHQMVFGNTSYNDFKPLNQDNNFEIYNYEITNKEFNKNEAEAFIVANDILEKVKNHYQVYDKDKGSLRDITYADFVILVDKSTNFNLYKKIFEYLGISLTILKDESITGNYDLFILKNILLLLKESSKKNITPEFKYAYLSLGRSYLFNLSDDYLYQKIKSGNYDDDIILEKINNLKRNIDNIPSNLLIENILDEFNFYEKLITVGNIDESIIRFDYLEELALNLSKLDYTYLDILNFFEKMIKENDEIKYSLNKDNQNSVKIMTIHKSKGLEYHVCYYTGLTGKFNLMDAKKQFVFDNNYGIITPIFDNGLKSTILHNLYKESYIKADVSERIRLFYVALTRAKEKMILVTTLQEKGEEEEDMVELDTRLKYNSFSSILNSISDKLQNYIKNIDLENYNLTKDYNLVKEENIKEQIEISDEKLEVLELEENNLEYQEEHFSKSNHSFVTKDIKDNLNLGTTLHYYLEVLDFKNPCLEDIPLNYQVYLEKFFKLDLLKDLQEATIYKEYEFIYLDNNIKKHGIIDLMLEYDNHIDIIDYKLKNINDLEYNKQLKGYRDYIKKKTTKKINLYLYSIIESTYREIN